MLSHLMIARAEVHPSRPSMRKHADFSCRMERWSRTISRWFGGK